MLAKWLRFCVRVWVRVRVGDRECTSCTIFFSSDLISVVNTQFGSLRKYAMVYLWFHVTWLVTSFLGRIIRKCNENTSVTSNIRVFIYLLLYVIIASFYIFYASSVALTILLLKK